MNLDNYQAVAMSLFFLYLQQYMYLSEHAEKYAIGWLCVAVLLLAMPSFSPFLATYVIIPGWIRIVCLLASIIIFVRYARRR